MRTGHMVEYDETARPGPAARQTLNAAASEAARMGARRTGTAHLLLALVGGRPDDYAGLPEEGYEPDAPRLSEAAFAVLAAAGVTRPRIEERLRAYHPYPQVPVWSSRPALPGSPANGERSEAPWSRGLAWVVQEAGREAHVIGMLHVQPADLLLAVTRPHDGTTAARLLDDLVEDPPWLHHKLVRAVTPSRESLLRNAVRHIDREVTRLEQDLDLNASQEGPR